MNVGVLINKAKHNNNTIYTVIVDMADINQDKYKDFINALSTVISDDSTLVHTTVKNFNIITIVFCGLRPTHQMMIDEPDVAPDRIIDIHQLITDIHARLHPTLCLTSIGKKKIRLNKPLAIALSKSENAIVMLEDLSTPELLSLANLFDIQIKEII